jgi:Response regulator containing CheY-like receiver domain and AraC-type DNA-binding domain
LNKGMKDLQKYKLVIVEDEPPIARNIKQKVLDSGTGFEVACLSYDGKDALDKIAVIKPNVVLVDINIPFIDGISLIRQVKHKYPEIIFIIISGYQDFEYARNAVKVGVEDYLLKPVSGTEITDILLKVEKQLKDIHTAKEREALINRIKNEKNGPESDQLISENNYYIVLLCFGPYSTYPANMIFNNCNYIPSQDIECFLGGYSTINERCWVFNGNNGNEKIMIIDTQSITKDNLIFSIQQLILLNKSVFLTAAISNQVNYSEIGSTVTSLRILLQEGIVIGKSQVISDRTQKSYQSGRIMVSSESERVLTALLLQGNKNILKSELQKLFQTWEKQNCTQANLDLILKHILSMLGRLIIEKSFSDSNPVKNIQINEVISTSLSFNDVFKGFWYLIEDMLENKKQKESRFELTKQLINQAENYISSNFAHPLTLQSLAEMVNLSPQYFCMIFKQYKGVSPIEYLINIRVEKAKELLLTQPKMLTGSISEIVGYSDQHYFSKIFKSVTGFSPKEFRTKFSEVI